jgi:hypothetical protein
LATPTLLATPSPVDRSLPDSLTHEGNDALPLQLFWMQFADPWTTPATANRAYDRALPTRGRSLGPRHLPAARPVGRPLHLNVCLPISAARLTTKKFRCACEILLRIPFWQQAVIWICAANRLVRRRNEVRRVPPTSIASTPQIFCRSPAKRATPARYHISLIWRFIGSTWPRESSAGRELYYRACRLVEVG